MTYIVNPKNKKEENVLETILKGLSIGYYTEEKEDAAIIKAMEKGRKTKTADYCWKNRFSPQIKIGKMKIEIRKSFTKDADKLPKCRDACLHASPLLNLLK
jgi:hypothetical protein